MSDQLVVARSRGTGIDGVPPIFTKPMLPEDMMREIEARIPVDVLYFMIPHPDGQGYTYREAGLVTVSVREILRNANQEVTTLQVAPLPSPSETEHHTRQGINDDYPLEGINDPLPVQDSYTFEKEHAPRLQQDLLAERGLEQPVNASGSTKRKKGKGKPTPNKKKATTDQEEALPHPVSLGSRRVVNSISTATQAEAASASRQIFK